MTEDQLFWQKKSKEFADTYLRPILFDFENGKYSYAEVVSLINQQDLRHWWIPKQYGGLGITSKLIGCVIVQELSKVSLDLMQIVAGPSLPGLFLMGIGSENQKNKYLRKMSDKSLNYVAAFALTESDSGSDISHMKAVAIPTEAGFILNGHKKYITNGDNADIIIVGANLLTNGKKALKFFLLDKESAKGLTSTRLHTSGLKGGHLGELSIDNCFIPKEMILGEDERSLQDSDFFSFTQIMESSRIGVGAAAIGIAEAAWERALVEIKNSVRGEKNLASNQAIKFLMVDLKNQIDAARYMVLKAAWLFDEGRPFSEAEGNRAKLYASEVAQNVVLKCADLFGARSFIIGHHVEKMLRDVRACLLWEGTSNVLKEISADRVLY